MKEDFVTYDQAVKLKELGFNCECNHMVSSPYNSNRVCFAPTLSQAQKWLREVKGKEVLVYKDLCNPKYYNLQYIENGTVSADDVQCDTYEEALSYGINELLGIE